MLRFGTWLSAAFMIFIGALGHAAEPKLVFGSSHNAPFSTPKGDGYFDVLIREACAVVHTVCETRMLPAERSFQDAARGIIDGDIGRINFVPGAYPDLLQVPHPVLRGRRFVAFSRDRNMRLDGWESLLRYDIAYVNGWKIFEDPTVGAKSVTRTTSIDQLFGLLVNRRVDAVLTADIDGLATIKRLGLRDVHMILPPLAVRDLYLLLNVRHGSLSKDLAGVFERFEKEDRMRTMLHQAAARFEAGSQ